MTGADNTNAAARLDELAAVTREYGAYSRTSHGIALIAYGMAFLAAAALDLRFGTQDARFAYTVGPVIWVVALWASRQRYQRHGRVIAQEKPLSPRARAWWLGLVTLLGGAMVFQLVGWSALLAKFRGDHGLWFPAAGAAFVACVTPVLVATITAGRTDLVTSVVFVTVCWMLAVFRLDIPGFAESPEAPLFHWMMVAVASLMAIASIIDGVRQHLLYRALERRLAALRSSVA